MNVNLVQVVLNHRRPPCMVPLREVARIGTLKVHSHEVYVDEEIEEQALKQQYERMYEEQLVCGQDL